LCTWAGPRGLLQGHKPIIAIYHDNPEITPENKQRISICLEVPESTEVSGEIGKMKIPAGEYAYARFELENGQFMAAWDMVYNGWLSESGYQPDDRPCFEIYYNDPKGPSPRTQVHHGRCYSCPKNRLKQSLTSNFIKQHSARERFTG
jgi:AraC family transcriptional regulator